MLICRVESLRDGVGTGNVAAGVRPIGNRLHRNREIDKVGAVVEIVEKVDAMMSGFYHFDVDLLHKWLSHLRSEIFNLEVAEACRSVEVEHHTVGEAIESHIFCDGDVGTTLSGEGIGDGPVGSKRGILREIGACHAPSGPRLLNGLTVGNLHFHLSGLSESPERSGDSGETFL